MVYLIKGDIMFIKEMIYLNREAQKGLWEYICAHESMIDEVRGNTYFGEPIAFDMEDGDIKESIRPYIMGRIVDVVRFLETYPCNVTKEEVVISLEVEDPVLDWNNRTFSLCFRDGRCHLTAEVSKYKAKLSIGTLTTLLLGYKTAMQLHRMERIEADAETVYYLDKVINHQMPYISDYI